MKKLLIVALALALPFGLVACKQQATEAPSASADATAAASTSDRQAETARLNAWFDEQYEEFLQFSPTTLTFQGRKDRYDELDDMSEAAMRERLDWMASSVAEMESSFDYDSLDPDAQLSWEIWKRQLDSAQAQWEFRAHRYAFDQISDNKTGHDVWEIRVVYTRASADEEGDDEQQDQQCRHEDSGRSCDIVDRILCVHKPDFLPSKTPGLERPPRSARTELRLRTPSVR
mgnify:CR=1 FL=1